jgi:hypothetical protein
VIEIVPSLKSLFPLGEEGVCTFVNGSHRRAVGVDSEQRSEAGAGRDDGTRRTTVEGSTRRAQRDPVDPSDRSTVVGSAAPLSAVSDVP